MKKFIIPFLLFLSLFTFAQTSEIVKLLNQQFETEQGFYDEYETSKPMMITPFQIKNDTLSFEFKTVYDDPDKIILTKREVHLKDIKEFIKDMNIIFRTNPKSVKETQIIKNNTGKTLEATQYFTDLFFTELHKNKEDEYTLRKQMLEAFKKAGYEVTSDYWYN